MCCKEKIAGIDEFMTEENFNGREVMAKRNVFDSEESLLQRGFLQHVFEKKKYRRRKLTAR